MTSESRVTITGRDVQVTFPDTGPFPGPLLSLAEHLTALAPDFRPGGEWWREPPEDIRDWFDPAIWWHHPGDFWEVQKDEVYRREGIIGCKPLEPFARFKGRDTHEIAHFIACDEADLFDPWWGIDTFTFRTDGKGKFNDDEATKEAEVLAIDYFLRDDYGDHNFRAAVELARHSNLRGIGPVSTFRDPEGICKAEYLNRELLKWVAEAWSAKWGMGFGRDRPAGLQALWTECVRKTNLVRQIRGIPGRWPC